MAYMKLIIPNIHASSALQDIRNFIQPALKKPFFGTYGDISNVEIQVLFNRTTKLNEYHGFVSISTDEGAKRVIKKLNRSKFLSGWVYVREFKIRNWHNDKRANPLADSDPIKGLQRDGNREGDRRRGDILEPIIDVSNMFYGVRNANRIYRA